MIFEIIISITLLYLYVMIKVLTIHFNNIEKDNNILYNNITKYITEVQILFTEISNVKTKNNDIIKDIKYLQSIMKENGLTNEL
jgi:hypothetical protein